MPVEREKAPAQTNEEVDSLSLYASLAANEDQEKRTLRRSIAVAVVLHGALLVATFPQLQSAELAPKPDQRKVFVVRNPRFEKPEIPKTEVKPKPSRTLIPVPDLTPDEPELPPMEFPVAETDFVDVGIVVNIPDAPPAPEQVGPIRVGGEVKAPERIHYVAPRYTEIARKARLQGTVVLETVVETNGEISQVKVLKSLNFGLAEEAVRAVEQWRFKPSTLNGKPVSVLYVLTVHFRLQ